MLTGCYITEVSMIAMYLVSDLYILKLLADVCVFIDDVNGLLVGLREIYLVYNESYGFL